jgi:hypothetical protein
MAITAVTDPEVTVLGGPIGASSLLLAEVQRTLDEPARSDESRGPIGDSAPLRGALEPFRRHARELL